jgi:hypothetical protein
MQKDGIYNIPAFLLRGFIASGVLIGALWQLEIVYITATNPLGWGYNFAGLGDFGWLNYQWRDFWYFIIFVDFIYLLYVTWNVGKLQNA